MLVFCNIHNIGEGNNDQYMYMIGQQLTFFERTFFLMEKFMEHVSKSLPQFREQHSLVIFVNEYNLIFAFIYCVS